MPGWAENRWSDLLATLIATDPTPMGRVLGVLVDDVRREVAVAAAAAGKSDRLDLLLTRAGAAVAAIEVKVLSDLGVDQLTRYQAAFPNLEAYCVLHLAALPVNVRDTEPWRSLAWEDVLAAYADTDHLWVAATARAWLSQLGELVPRVDAETVWNDVPDKPADFELALRARVSWLTAQMHAWCTLPHDSVQSSGGGNWAVRMWHEATSPGHLVTAEMQEGMTAYEWRHDPTRPYRERLRGPVVLIGLREDGPDTSEGFDWQLLHRMFAQHILDDTGQPADGRSWRTTSARPNDPVDKQNWLEMVKAGAPRWLGQGWGMRVARSTRSSLFGGRFEIPATATLRIIDTELRKTQMLLRAMASTSH